MSVFAETEIPRMDATGPAEALLDRLNDPATAAAVGDLLDESATLADCSPPSAALWRAGEEIMGNVAETYQEFASLAMTDPALAGGVKTALKLATQGAPVMARVADADVLQKLATSSLLDPDLFDVIEMIATGVGRAHAGVAGHPGVQPPSLFQMGRTMNDPDVRRGVRFLLEVAKQLGRSLGEPPSTTPSTAPSTTPSTTPSTSATATATATTENQTPTPRTKRESEDQP